MYHAGGGQRSLRVGFWWKARRKETGRFNVEGMVMSTWILERNW
jgi:hypothetical protein